MIKDDITEHFNYKELINSFKKNMEGQMKVKKNPKENLYCKEKLREIINDIDDDKEKDDDDDDELYKQKITDKFSIVFIIILVLIVFIIITKIF